MSLRLTVIVWDVAYNKPLPEDERLEALQSVENCWNIRQGRFGIDCAGIYAPFGSTKHVTTVAMSKSRKLLAAGDKYGFLKLLESPSPRFGATTYDSRLNLCDKV